MDRILLGRAASFLQDTRYTKVSGKVPTSSTLKSDIESLFDGDSSSPTYEPTMDFYRGYSEIAQPLVEAGEPLENVLGHLFVQIEGMLHAQPMSAQNQAMAYVLAGLSAIKAAIDLIERRDIVGQSSDKVNTDRGVMEIVNILESIDWEMSKTDIKNAFRYMESIGDHPTENAIGFSTRIMDVETGVICYFYRKLLGEKLAAVNIILHQTPPAIQVLKNDFTKVVQAITSRFGEPRVSQGDFIAWITRGKTIAASTKTGLVGIRYGDPKYDPPSQILIGTR